MVHEHIDSTDAERSQMRRSLRHITEARPQSKLHISLQLEQLPRITRWLMDAGSQRFSEFREGDLGKVEVGQLAWWWWQCTE